MTERADRPRRTWAGPMRPRDVREVHRAATPLELLFDLCFVVAVAAVSDRLHHAISEDHVGHGVIAYLIVFFGIWWAWMNFTWFASAYDCDDIVYRLTTFVQIAGGLILAAGVPRAFDEKDFTIIVIGYAVMRVGLVTQWLRVAAGDPAGRRTAQRFAVGVTSCMVGWAALVALPGSWFLPGFLVLAAAELSVPIWAERAHETPWHPRHIAERYGLFTLIVLGETVLAASMAVKTGLDAGAGARTLLAVAGCGLVIVFGMWWLYFDQHAERFLRSNREGFRWGYGHYLIFSSAAAVAVPVAVFLVCVWLLHVRPQRPAPVASAAFPVTAALVLATIATPWALPLTAALVVGLVACWVLVGAGASEGAT